MCNIYRPPYSPTYLYVKLFFIWKIKNTVNKNRFAKHWHYSRDASSREYSKNRRLEVIWNASRPNIVMKYILNKNKQYFVTLHMWSDRPTVYILIEALLPKYKIKNETLHPFSLWPGATTRRPRSNTVAYRQNKMKSACVTYRNHNIFQRFVSKPSSTRGSFVGAFDEGRAKQGGLRNFDRT